MSEPVLVHRIEDADGYGPFQSLPFWGEPDGIDWDAYNENVDEYPSPASDPGFDQRTLRDVIYSKANRGRLWECGCCSPEQLRHWFDERTCKLLAKAGFRYAVFKAEKAIEGAFQAVFDRRSSELVNAAPADALYSDAA